MKKVLLGIAAICCSCYVNAQNFEWAKNIGSSGDDRGNVVKQDASGNVYVAGAFNGTVDFDPGSGSASLTSAGDLDLFVAKYDAMGNFLWVQGDGNVFDDLVFDMDIDNSGNVFITGYGELNTSGSQRAMFVAKADASGVEQWSYTFTSDNGNIGGYALTTDATGNVYVAGNFNGTVDFDPDLGTTDLTPTGSNSDAFILKLNTAGELVFVKQFESSNANDNIVGMAVDASGNLYTVGQYWNSLDCDPGPGTAYLGHSGNGDAFIAKLDASGNYVWAKKLGGSGSDYSVSVAVDASGNVITTGYFEGTVDFDPGAGTSNLSSGGARDAYISKLDSNGDFVWAKSMGSTADDRGAQVALDAAGNVYTIGYFEGTADFDPGSGTNNLASVSDSRDVFLQKLDATGNFIWAHNIGTENADFGTSIIVDASDNIYFGGHLNGTADFDPGIGTSNLTSAGGNDIFFAKWTQCAIDAATSVNGLTITASNSVASYQWVDCDNGNTPIAGETGQTFTASQNGNYAVVITEGNCSETSDCVAITSVGINDKQVLEFTKVYPNPFSNVVSIDLNGFDGQVEIQILDMTGRVAFTDSKNGTRAVQLNLAELRSGAYSLFLRGEHGKISVGRLIKN